MPKIAFTTATFIAHVRSPQSPRPNSKATPESVLMYTWIPKTNPLKHRRQLSAELGQTNHTSAQLSAKVIFQSYIRCLELGGVMRLKSLDNALNPSGIRATMKPPGKGDFTEGYQ